MSEAPRIILPRGQIHTPGYLAETAQRHAGVQRFCLPSWEVSRLWLEGWQPMVERRTEGGLLEGTCFRLKPMVIPVSLAVTQMAQQEAV